MTVDVVARARIARISAMARTKPHRVISFGDSFDSTYAYTTTATSHKRRSASGMGWLQRLSGQRLEYSAALSVAQGGQTTRDALTVTAGGAAAALDRLRPGIAIWQVGTNDTNPGSGVYDPVATLANDRAFIALCQDRGIVCMLATISPRGAWSDNPSDTDKQLRRRYIHQVNLARIDAARRQPGVILADTWSLLADPEVDTGAPLASVTGGDLLHPSDGAGGFLLGKARWEALRRNGWGYDPLMPNCLLEGANAVVAARGVAGNRLQNPGMRGSGGSSQTGVAGACPDFYYATRGSGTTGTLALSRSARADGLPGTMLRAVASTPAGSEGTQRFVIKQTGSAPVFAGETIDARASLHITKCRGGQTPQLQVQFLDAAQQVIFTAMDGDVSGTLPDLDMVPTVMAIDPVVVPTGAVSARLSVYVAVSDSTASNTMDVQIGDAFLGVTG